MNVLVHGNGFGHHGVCYAHADMAPTESRYQWSVSLQALAINHALQLGDLHEHRTPEWARACNSAGNALIGRGPPPDARMRSDRCSDVSLCHSLHVTSRSIGQTPVSRKLESCLHPQPHSLRMERAGKGGGGRRGGRYIANVMGCSVNQIF